MYPHERSLVKKHANDPFAIIGVNSDPDLKALAKTLKDESITWRSFWNGPTGIRGPISQAWNVSGWPTVYLMDAKGVIRNKWIGAPKTSALDPAIEKLIAEARADATDSENQ